MTRRITHSGEGALSYASTRARNAGLCRCDIVNTVPNPVAETVFRRGDANVDGDVDVSDVVFTLEALFGTSNALVCLDSSDSNDDGFIDVSDSVATLLALFRSVPIPDPGASSCGADPTTEDELDCAAYDASCL